MNIADRLAAALRAIDARIAGRFDDPDLLTFGALQDVSTDCQRIVRETLTAYDSYVLDQLAFNHPDSEATAE